MEQEIEIKEEELALIESLKSRLNVKEYNELNNIIERYIQLARNESWEAKTNEARFNRAIKARDENYNKYIDEEKEKNKWKSYYTEVCNKYAKIEIELDIAKAKIQILEGGKNEN